MNLDGWSLQCFLTISISWHTWKIFIRILDHTKTSKTKCISWVSIHILIWHMFYTSGKHRSGNLLNDFLRWSPGIYYPKEIIQQGVNSEKSTQENQDCYRRWRERESRKQAEMTRITHTIRQRCFEYIMDPLAEPDQKRSSQRGNFCYISAVVYLTKGN